MITAGQTNVFGTRWHRSEVKLQSAYAMSLRRKNHGLENIQPRALPAPHNGNLTNVAANSYGFSCQFDSEILYPFDVELPQQC